MRNSLFLIPVALVVVACTSTYVLTSNQSGVSAVLTESEPGPLVELSVCGTCASGDPDQVFAVPPNFSSGRLTTSDGGYYHKPGTCDCFVGEVWMYFNSNKIPYPDGAARAVRVSGDAFDLPSSEAYGDTLPENAEDCRRYYRATRIWQRLEGESVWTQMGKQEAFGSWSGGSCSITGRLGENLDPSSTNQARRLRVAIKVLLRETAQKAAVHIDQLPPR